MAGYRYWRMKITSVFSGPTVGIAELIMLDSGKNSILPNTISASNSFDSNSLPEKMLDGNPQTHWVSANPPSYPVYVTLEYDTPVLIDYLDMRARHDLGDRTPREYSVEVSSDGANWAPFWTAFEMPHWSNGEVRRISIQGTASQNYKEIRVYIPRTRSAGNYALAEVYVRDKGGAIITGPVPPNPIYPAPWTFTPEKPTTDRPSSIYPPEFAFDGNPNTFWWGDVAPSAATYIGYRFPLNAPPARTIGLLARPSFMTDSPRDFNVQFSGDSGATWTKIYESLDEPPWSASELRTYTLPPDYDYTVSPIITTARRRFSPCAG